MLAAFLLTALALGPEDAPAAPIAADRPRGDEVQVDTRRGEVRFNARVQHPRGKPCIDAFGERIQAFVGCAWADGHPSEFADHFVFLAGAPTEEIYRGLVELGLKADVHVSRAEGRKRGGKDFLKGDPVELTVAWDEGGRRVEHRYEDLVDERVVIDGKEVVRPWRPRFAFYGSGVLHKEGTGCIACPCDCPGGIIADVTNPIYEPKPTVRFVLAKAPPEGSVVVVVIRAAKDKQP